MLIDGGHNGVLVTNILNVSVHDVECACDIMNFHVREMHTGAREGIAPDTLPSRQKEGVHSVRIRHFSTVLVKAMRRFGVIEWRKGSERT